MTRKTAHDFDQELLILFDAYVHGGIDRRTFLDRATKFAVGGVTAAMLLDQLSPKFLEAQVVKPEDSRIQQEHIEFDSPDGYGRGEGISSHPPAPPAHFRASWSFTRIGVSTPTSRTSLGGWPSTTSWRSRPTRSFPWVATRETKTTPVNCSGSSTGPRPRRTSWRPAPSSGRGRSAPVGSARWGSATAVGW